MFWPWRVFHMRLAFLSCPVDSCETGTYTATGTESWNSLKSTSKSVVWHLASDKVNFIFVIPGWCLSNLLMKVSHDGSYSFPSTIYSVAFNIFIITMFFTISNLGSFLLQSSLINFFFLFTMDTVKKLVFFPFCKGFLYTRRFANMCKGQGTKLNFFSSHQLEQGE